MDIQVPSPRSNPFIPLFLVAGCILLVVFGARQLFQAPVADPINGWIEAARRSLRAGQPVPPLPADVVPSPEIIATSIPFSLVGLHEQETLRCGDLLPGSGSSLLVGFPQSGQSRMVFQASPPVSFVMAGAQASVNSGEDVSAAKLRDIRQSLAIADGGLAKNLAQLGSETFLQHLVITLATATFLANPSDEEITRILGPLFQNGRSRFEVPKTLPKGFLQLPTNGNDLPEALGLLFECFQEFPAPNIDWDPAFKARLASSPELVQYARIWEARQAKVATWVPLLCDNVGELLRSGALRFNRPDVLPPAADLLSPMDEVQLLLAFFQAGCYSSLRRWYPRQIASVTAVLDPFTALPPSLVERYASADDLLKALAEPVNPHLDRFLLLEKGDLTIESLAASQTLWIGCLNGNLTLKGSFFGPGIFLATKGGNIIVNGGRAPNLLALPDQEKGGRIVVNAPTTFAGNIGCQTLEFSTGAGESRLLPDFFPAPAQILVVVRKPANR